MLTSLGIPASLGMDRRGRSRASACSRCPRRWRGPTPRSCSGIYDTGDGRKIVITCQSERFFAAPPLQGEQTEEILAELASDRSVATSAEFEKAKQG